jgi:FHA domain
MSCEIHVQTRDPFGVVRELTFNNPGPLWIGRDAECEVPLLAPNVSRRHVSVELCPEGLKVTDASSNGTFVNELALRRAVRIVPEAYCVLGVGSHTVTIRWGDTPIGQQPPTARSGPVHRAPAGVAATSKGAAPSQPKPSAETEPPAPARRDARAVVGRSVDARRRIHRQLLEPLQDGSDRHASEGALGSPTDRLGNGPGTTGGRSAGRPGPARWASFFFSAHGDGQSVRDFFGDDLARNVQCDGTSVTNCIERAGGKRPGCMAHARRRFVEAARLGDTIARDAPHSPAVPSRARFLPRWRLCRNAERAAARAQQTHHRQTKSLARRAPRAYSTEDSSRSRSRLSPPPMAPSHPVPR